MFLYYKCQKMIFLDFLYQMKTNDNMMCKKFLYSR